VGTRWATARRMHVRIKVRGAGGSRQARWIVAEAAIAWAIVVYHQAPAAAPREEAAPLAELRVGRAAAARARAVRGVPPVWAAPAVAPAAVAGGGGNQT